MVHPGVVESRCRDGLLGLAFGALLAPTAFHLGSRAPYADPDFFWATSAGRWMFQHGGVIRQNVFSFTAPEHPWVFHEWGLGVLAAGVEALLGAHAPLALALFACVTVFVALLFVATRESVLPGEPAAGTASAAGLALAALVMVAVGPFFAVPRPTVLAAVFPLAAASLAFGPRFEVRHLAWAVVLQLGWANAHGSFPLGPVFFAVAAFEARGSERWRLLGLASVLGALVSLANPYGWQLHRLVFAYLMGAGPASVAHDHLLEFQSLFSVLHVVQETDLVMLVLLALLSLVALRTHPARGALMLLLIAMTVRQQRHYVVAMIVALPVLRAPAEHRFRALGFDPSRVGRARVRRAALVAGAVMLAVFTLPRLPAPLADPDLARAIAALPDGARVHATFGANGFVIATSRARVFYDERNDPYPESVAVDAFAVDAGDFDALARRGATHVLRRTGSMLPPGAMEELGEWTLVSLDAP